GDGVGSKLLSTKANMTFLNTTSGGIVKALASEAGLDVKECEDGISYPYYVVDDRWNFLEHIVRLGRMCGADVFFDADGKLFFRRPGGGKEHRLTYGIDVLELSVSKKRPAYEGAVIFGESPVSSKGTETYHWIAKEELKVMKGEGRTLIVVEAPLKSRESAEKAAEYILYSFKYVDTLTVRTEGMPQIRIGDALVLDGFNEPEIDGSHEVTRLEHLLHPSFGFTSVFTCRRVAE
ncbi:MAG: hypothetical protein QFX35_07500, partial [Candidatus Verstraetearchaeota archaeon]|nr:hypothetical protein [Candidatus Verstraetearchaeota archaeon]